MKTWQRLIRGQTSFLRRNTGMRFNELTKVGPAITETILPEISKFALAVCNRIIALVFLIYFAPVMFGVAFLIKLDSDGPVLRRRLRRGSNGVIVKLWEFRTMIEEKADDGASTVYASGQTVLGAFLCRSRLEMLPRLVNMLRGEVSFGALLS